MKPITITLIAAIFIGLPLFSGCVCVPRVSTTDQITVEELSQHVDFLSQHSLKGRAAGSWESRHVRRYLSQHLQAYGCVPWANNPSFELDFGFGKNIIAVLPGSDPQFAGEIVLISAHYDHLRPRLFKWYPGACDNAAAVAVLLEIAEKLSRQPSRPKRSVCFAFFDAEEMGCVGSYAFTGRDDYDDDAIVAALNMDMLGRDLLDVVDHCLIATGTEHYAALQQFVNAACADNGLQCLPLDADLIGPVGDHTAFTSDRRPVLFFSCGINKDYHQPTDTPDKLNYTKLEKEAAVVEQTLLALANDEQDVLTRRPAPITSQHTDAFAYILNKFKDHQDVFKLDPNGIQTLDTLIAQTTQIDPNTLTRRDLVELERQALGKLITLLKDYNKTLSQYSDIFIRMSEYYAVNPPAVTAIYRQMIGHYLENKPSLFGKNAYRHQAILPVNENSWGLTKTEDGKYIFGFVDLEIEFENQLLLLSGNSFSCQLNYKITACQGHLNDIVDFAFWGTLDDPNEFSMKMVSAYTDKAETSMDNLLSRRNTLASAFRETVERQFPEDLHLPAIQKLADPNGFAMDPNTIFHNVFLNDPNRTPGPDNRYCIFLRPQDKKHPEIDEKELIQCFIRDVKDASRSPEDRADSIGYLVYKKTQAGLSAIADILDDTTPYKSDPDLMTSEIYPLRHHPVVKQMREQQEDTQKKRRGKTLGHIALQQLKQATKKDFGTDKEAWKQWIAKHYQ